jgi:AAA+ superfamily predicted ATPase
MVHLELAKLPFAGVNVCLFFNVVGAQLLLFRGLAQKLAIRLSGQFQYGQLVEVNAHSLFSKWFSESGKLVQKLFGKIEELVEERDSLVIVLIDEVESLTAARKSALSGSEPSDAIRVVNAVLTQIDKLKQVCCCYSLCAIYPDIFS